MRARAEAGFVLSATDLRNDIIVPRYYDPRIEDDLAALSSDYELYTIGQLIEAGHIEHSHGAYVPKMYYGSGPYPYIRTSDLANWELRASPKHGVSADVFDAYNEDQDVRPGDILFVHEGTYLIGTAAMVTEQDGQILYQHHLAKFRIDEEAPFSAHYFLAALASPIVQRQIRARQFSADIIDSVVGRVEEVIVPIPRNFLELERIGAIARTAIESRANLRAQLSSFFAELETPLRNADVSGVAELTVDANTYGGQTFLGEREFFIAFSQKTTKVKDDILIPKYYNPQIINDLDHFKSRADLKTIAELVECGQIIVSTGDEIGRLNYGSGNVSFVRTSDLGTFELKSDSKHGVDEGVWAQYSPMQNVCAGDILLVRDGTYLVGSSAMIFEEDLPLLYCGGIYKLSCPTADLPSGLVYALLNLPIVKRQLRSKQFTRDVIDTIGQRLFEIVLPIPRDVTISTTINEFVASGCKKRVAARAVLRELCASLFVKAPAGLATLGNHVRPDPPG